MIFSPNEAKHLKPLIYPPPTYLRTDSEFKISAIFEFDNNFIDCVVFSRSMEFFNVTKHDELKVVVGVLEA